MLLHFGEHFAHVVYNIHNSVEVVKDVVPWKFGGLSCALLPDLLYHVLSYSFITAYSSSSHITK